MKLEDILYARCNSPKPHIFLMGHGGGGKSSQLFKLYEKLLADLSCTERRIPLYLALNSYDGQSDFIVHKIMRRFCGMPLDGTSDEANRQRLMSVLNSPKRQFVLLLDGINETSSDSNGLFTEINELASCAGVQMVITGRYDIHLDDRYFEKYILGPLDEGVVIKTVPGYCDFNARLKKLLTLPAYLRIFEALRDENKGSITSASELMDSYFSDTLQKITRAETAASTGYTYMEQCRQILYEVFPRLVYQNYAERSSYLVFYKSDLDAVTVPGLEKPCSTALCELGLICEAPAEKSFGVTRQRYKVVHELYFDYFFAYRLACLVTENRPEADRVLQNLKDTAILTAFGERIGEHKFADKASYLSAKSPAESLLDRYRGDFSGESAAIVAKYADVIRLSRANTRSVDLGSLDLRDIVLYGESWNNSSFRNSLMNEVFAERAFFENYIRFVFFIESANTVIVSDLKTKILILDINFRVKGIIALSADYSPDYIISVYPGRVTVAYKVSSSDAHGAGSAKSLYCVSGEYVFGECADNADDNAQYIIRPDFNSEYNFAEEIFNPDIISERHKLDPFLPEPMYVYTCTFRESHYSVKADAMAIWLRKKDSSRLIEYKRLQHNHMTEAEVDTSECGFESADGTFIGGDLLINCYDCQRVYNIAQSKCVYFSRHRRNLKLGSITHGYAAYNITPARKRYLGRQKLRLNPQPEVKMLRLKNIPLKPAYVYKMTKGYNPFSKTKKLDVSIFGTSRIRTIRDVPLIPPVGQRMSKDRLFIYNSEKICLCLSPRYIPQLFEPGIDGDFMYSGVNLYDDMFHIVYTRKNRQTGRNEVHFAKYSIPLQRVISDTDTGISLSMEPSFEEGIANNINVVELNGDIFIRHGCMLSIYLHSEGRSFDYNMLYLDIYDIHRILIDGSRVWLFHGEDRHTRLTLSRSGNPFATATLASRGTKISEEPLAADNNLYIKRDLTLRFLKNTDIRGCDFSGARVLRGNGTYAEIPEEILYNI